MREFGRFRTAPQDPQLRQLLRLSEAERRISGVERRAAAAVQTGYAESLASLGYAAINTLYTASQPAVTVDVQAGQLVSVYYMADITTASAGTPQFYVDFTDGTNLMFPLINLARGGAGTTTVNSVPGSTTGAGTGIGSTLAMGGWSTFFFSTAGTVTFQTRRQVNSLAGTPTIANQRLWIEVR